MASTRSTSNLSPPLEPARHAGSRGQRRRLAGQLVPCALGTFTIAWLAAGVFGNASVQLNWLEPGLVERGGRRTEEPAAGFAGVPGVAGGMQPGAPAPVVPGVKGAMLAGRNPQLRKPWLEQGGGNQSTEDAVALALEWLAKHQNPDGHWSLHAFDRTGDCKKRCGQPGMVCDTAGTALALLPFLGNGETHRSGPHAEAIGKGLRWLIAHEGPDGRWIESVYTEMYAHAMATIVLCEALAPR